MRTDDSSGTHPIKRWSVPMECRWAHQSRDSKKLFVVSRRHNGAPVRIDSGESSGSFLI
jgi:hypothetical protein